MLLFYIFMYKCFVFVICSKKNMVCCDFDFCETLYFCVSLLYFGGLPVVLRHYYVMSRSLDVKENVFSSVRLIAVL